MQSAMQMFADDYKLYRVIIKQPSDLYIATRFNLENRIAAWSKEWLFNF